MKKLQFKITGTSPLLMHAYKGNDNPELKTMSPKDQAEFGAYRSATGELVLPSENIHQAMIKAAPKVKKGLQQIVAGAVIFSDVDIPLGAKDFTVDSRGVVVMKARIIRHRARLDSWGGSVTLEYDPTLTTEKEIVRTLELAGQLVGVGDYRPEKKGPFGRFQVQI